MGLSVTGDLALDGDLDFQGPQNITTTSDNLTISPTGSLIIDTSGNTVYVRDAWEVSQTSQFSGDLTLAGNANQITANNDFILTAAGSLILDTSTNNTDLRLQGGLGELRGDYGTIVLAAKNSLTLDTSQNNTNLLVQTGTGDFNVNNGQLVVDGNGSLTLAPSNSQVTVTGNVDVSSGLDVTGTTTLGDGGTTNYLSISNTGDLTMNGAANNIITNNDLVIRSGNSLTLDTSANNNNLLVRTGSGTFDVSVGSYSLTTSSYTQTTNGSINRTVSGNITDRVTGANNYVLRVGNSASDSDANGNDIFISAVDKITLNSSSFSQTTSGNTETIVSAGDYSVLVQGNNDLYLRGGGAGRDDVTNGGDLQLAAEDSFLLDAGDLTITGSEDSATAIAIRSSRGGITLSTSSASGNGNLSLLSAGTLTLDTSSKNSNLRLQTGSGTLSASLGTATISTEIGPISIVSRSSPINLITESITNGSLVLSSTGNLYLDTSRTGASVFLQGGLARIGSGGTVNNISGSGSLYVQSNLEVDGDVYLGATVANNLTLTGQIASDLVPNVGSTFDLGSTTNRWAEGFIDTLTVTTLNSAANNISGITGNTFTIDTSNTSGDTQDISITFERGTPATNTQLLWDASEKYFAFNAALTVSPDTDIITLSGENAILNVNDSYGGRRIATFSEKGTPRAVIDSSGNILLYQGSNIETSAGTLTMRGYSGLTLTTSSATTGEIRVLSRGTLQLDTSANNDNILLKTGSGNINVSTGTLTMTGLLDIRDSTGTLALATDSNGNVGVGTNAPTGILDILGQCVTGDTVLKRRRRRKGRTLKGGAAGDGPEPKGRGKSDLYSFDDVEDVRIDEIKAGDEILTLDERTGKFVWQRVEKTMDKGCQTVYELKTITGKYIQTTSNHPYLVQKIVKTEWIKVFQLKQGMIIATLDGWEKIADIKKIGRKQTYDLQIEATHNFVGGHYVDRLTGYALTAKDEQAIGELMAEGTAEYDKHHDESNDRQGADKFGFGDQLVNSFKSHDILSSLIAKYKYIVDSKILDVNSGKFGDKGMVKKYPAEMLTKKPAITLKSEEKAAIDFIQKRLQELGASVKVHDLRNVFYGGIVAHNTTGILMRAGASSLQLSSSATSTTADIELAAADRVDVFASTMTLSTSSTTAGELKLTSKGSLILDTSGAAGGGAPIALQAGSGNINLSSTGTITLTGNTSLNNGTLKLNGLTYTFPGTDSANGVLLSNGSGVLSWTTLGASSITADSLDFTEFKDSMTLDADTSINGPYSFIIRAGNAARQNATSGSNDLQLAAEDELSLFATRYSLSVSNGDVNTDINGDNDFILRVGDGAAEDATNGNDIWLAAEDRIDLRASGLTLSTSSTSAGELRVTSSGSLTLDTSANNSNILLKTGSGNINVSTGTLTMTGVLDVRDSTGTLGLVVDSTGNVGVGTTGPGAKLHVVGASTRLDTDSLSILDTTGGSTYVTLGNGSTFWGGTLTARSSVYLATVSGNVGIGSTSPVGILDILGQCVAGDTRLRRRRKRRRGTKNLELGTGPEPENPSSKLQAPSSKLQALSSDDDFEEVRIDEIKEGDEILTLDEQTGAFVWQTVEATMNKGIQAVIELATEDGKRIETTAEHPYLVRQTFGGVEFNRDENQGAGNQNQSGGDLGRSHDVPEILSSHFDDLSDINANNKNSVPNKTDLVKARILLRSDHNPNAGDTKINPYQAADKLPQIPETTRNKEILSLLANEKLIPLNLSGSCQSVKWLKVNNLKIGMEIATINGWQKIISIKQVGRKQVYDLQIAATHNFVGNGIVAHNTTGILMRAGASTPTLSSGTTSTTADIHLAAADQIRLDSGTLTLATSSTTAGELKLTSKGSLILDTSGAAGGGAPIALQAGSGNINLSSTGTITLTGNTSLNNGTLRLNGLTYTFPGADSANGVLLSNGSGGLSWTTLGASSITADSLDFSEFKDEMTLDADTSINGDYSLIVRSGLGARQNATSGNNDLQLSAEDQILIHGTALTLETSSATAGQMLLRSDGSMTFDTSGGTGNFAFVGGNVGIGTTGPGYLLEVQKDQNSPTTINVKNVTAGTGAYSILNAESDSATGFLRTHSASFTNAGAFRADGVTLATGTGASGGLSIGAFQATLGAIRFYTAGSADANERMVIDNTGNVGIGTTSPLGKLDIQGDSGILLKAGAAAISLSSGTTSSSDLQLAAADRIDLFAGSLSLQTSSTSAGDLKIISKGSLILDTSSSLGGSAPIILQGGNVGIGTASPSSKFQVLSSSGSQFALNYDASNYQILDVNSTGALSFAQDGGSATLTLSSGNVGIGTTGPGAKLDVIAGAGAGTTEGINVTGSDSQSVVARFNRPSVLEKDFTIHIYGNSQAILASEGDLALATDQSGQDQGTTRLMIKSTTGNLGIGSTSPAGLLDTYGDKSILLRAGTGAVSISGGAGAGADDIQLAAEDRIDLFASSLSLQTSSQTAGELKLMSKGSLILDTSGAAGGGAPIALQAGSGNINLSSTGTITLTGNTSLNNGTLKLNGLTYTFPGTDSANGVLLSNGSGVLSWTTLGASSITADSLDFSEFKDELTLDADTTINGDYSLVLRTGLGSIQNSTSGSNDLQLSAEDKLILGAASFDLLTSSGGVDILSAGRIDLSAGGTLTLDTSSNNSNILLKTGSGNINVSTGTLSMTGILDVRDSTGTLGLVVDSTGNVGIGTTGPIWDLHIKKTVSGGVVRSVVENGSNTSASDARFIAITAGTSGGDPEIIWDNSSVTWWAGLDTSDLNKWKLSYNAALGTGDKLVVNTAGNLGIGTAAPGAILHVKAITGTKAQLVLQNTGESSTDDQLISFAGSDSQWNIGQDESDSDKFKISADGNGDVGASTRLTIDGTGNIGIGSTSPTGILDILGQCVTGDTLLRRRKKVKGRRKKGEEWEWEDIPITEIREGDEILTLDENSGKFVVSTVKQLMNMGQKKTIELITQSGKSIRTTARHPYLMLIEKQNVNSLQKASFEHTEKVARQYYFANLAGRKVYCPALKENIHFTNIGWNHFVEKARSTNELITRFFALPRIPALFAKSSKKPLYEKRKKTDMTIEYWTINETVENVLVRAVICSIDNGPKFFLSCTWLGTKEKRGIPANKKELSLARILTGRRRGLVTPQLFNKLNIPKGQRGVKWIEVSHLKAGQKIATVDGWETIISIRETANEQVWDIEVEGTHNFVGNGIVAHNTTGILMRAGASSLQLSSSATSTTADIELAAADRIDLFAGSLSLQTSSTTAGDLKIISKGSLILDTSSSLGGSAPIIMNGNVGIGTTGPGRKLDVVGATDGTMQLRLGQTPVYYWELGREGAITGRFSLINNENSVITEPLSILTSGNVGIGSTSPASKLNVVTDDATTNAVTDVVTVDHTTSGTAAANIGSGLLFRSEDEAGTAQNTGRVSGIFSSIGSAENTGLTALKFETRGITYGTNTGTFATTSQAQLPAIRAFTTSTSANIGGTQYLYSVGGWDTSTRVSTVYKATVDSSGNVGTFSTTSQGQIPVGISDLAALTTSVGGTYYMYIIGGESPTGAVSAVYKATIDASGNVGTFATTSQGQLPATRDLYGNNAVIATIGGTQYVYVVGGTVTGGATRTSTVYKAQIDTSGNIGTFATTSQAQVPTLIGYHTTVTAPVGGTQYLYVIGGTDGAAANISAVYKATIDSSGNVGTFATTSQAQLPIAMSAQRTSVVSIGGTQYIYMVGGNNGAYLSTVYKATIDSSGNVGTFATTSQAQLTVLTGYHSAEIVSVGGTKYLYTLGNYNPTTYSTVYKSTIGPDTGSSTLTEKMRITDNGNVGIGDTSPDYKLDVWGTICQDTDSNDTCDGTVTSDIRLKTNIEIIPEALAKIKQLRGVTFNWDETNQATEHLGRGTQQVGMIAQEVEALFPSLVFQDMQGYKMLDYQKLVALNLEGIKELEGRAESSEQRAESNEQRITQLEDYLALTTNYSPSTISTSSDPSSLFLLPSSLSLSGSYMDNELAIKTVTDLTISHSGLDPESIDIDSRFRGNDIVRWNDNGLQILSSATIGGNLTIGLLTINDMDASINSMGETLKLQSLALDNIEIMAGKIVIDTEGNIKVGGNIEAQTVAAQEFKVLGSKSSGSAILRAGDLTLTVSTEAVTPESRVFTQQTVIPGVDPGSIQIDSGSGAGTTLIVRKLPGIGFEVRLPAPAVTDTPFDWFVIGGNQ